MSIQQNVASLLKNQVILDVEGIDRMYLNAYVPLLQSEGGVVVFFKQQRGVKVVGTSLMAPESAAFIKAIEQFSSTQHIPTLHFEKRQKKEDVAKEYLRAFKGREGVLFIGIAQ